MQLNGTEIWIAAYCLCIERNSVCPEILLVCFWNVSTPVNPISYGDSFMNLYIPSGMNDENNNNNNNYIKSWSFLFYFFKKGKYLETSVIADIDKTSQVSIAKSVFVCVQLPSLEDYSVYI